jgi:hypothetical protein
VGPASDLLFRNYERLSNEDQEQVNKFAEFLADKGKQKKEQ